MTKTATRARRRRRTPPQDSPPPIPGGLPTEKSKPVFDLRRYTILLYGREKIGKTTFFASVPDALFLAAEPGLTGQEVYSYNGEQGGAKNWGVIRKAVEDLEKEPSRFPLVVLDTVDRAYDMCLDWVCDKLGIPYPGQDDTGREDFGKSWRAVKLEFLSAIHRIRQTGRGIAFTSHAKETTIRSRSGDSYTRIFPSMSGQARSVVEALVDIFAYAEYVESKAAEKSIRVLITEGDETIWAGHRRTKNPLPRFLPLLETDGFGVLAAAFEGEDVGLDPKTFMPSRQTSETAKKFMRAMKRA